MTEGAFPAMQRLGSTRREEETTESFSVMFNIMMIFNICRAKYLTLCNLGENYNLKIISKFQMSLEKIINKC